MIENCINTYNKFFLYHDFNEMESRGRPKKLSIGIIISITILKNILIRCSK